MEHPDWRLSLQMHKYLGHPLAAASPLERVATRLRISVRRDILLSRRHVAVAAGKRVQSNSWTSFFEGGGRDGSRAGPAGPRTRSKAPGKVRRQYPPQYSAPVSAAIPAAVLTRRDRTGATRSRTRSTARRSKRSSRRRGGASTRSTAATRSVSSPSLCLSSGSGSPCCCRTQGSSSNSDHGWAIFLWGGGAIILLGAIVRLMVPRFRRPLVGAFVWGAIWVGVGFGLWYRQVGSHRAHRHHRDRGGHPRRQAGSPGGRR